MIPRVLSILLYEGKKRPLFCRDSHLFPARSGIEYAQEKTPGPKGGAVMTTRERLLALRILKKTEKYPTYGQKIGVTATLRNTGAQTKGRRDNNA